MKKYYKNKAAIITGASKGIGKAIAAELIKYGCDVCLIARNITTLRKTEKELKQQIPPDSNSKITIIACNAADYKSINLQLTSYIEKHNVPDLLINCVGYAYPNYLSKYSFKDFKNNMDTNFYGQLAPILAIIPFMSQKKSGHIINCSSVAGYLGTMGYTAYTPTKYAIAGLSEAIRHELKPLNINISVIYPPDTKTPGFDTEEKSKPEELKIISQNAGLLTPEQVAKKVIKGIKKKKFYIHVGQSIFLWRLVRFFPTVMHKILDLELKKAIKKISNKKQS